MHLWGLPDDTYPCVYVLVQLGQCSRGTENESATHEDARGQGVMTPLREREREREREGWEGGWQMKSSTHRPVHQYAAP